MSVRAKATDKAVTSDPTMNPPSSVCSTPDSSCDFELSSSPPSTCQKPVIGGLSCLFSSSSLCGDELKSEELKEPSLSSSCAYSCPIKCSGSSLREHLSPVSVFAGAVSSECSGGSTVVVDSAKRCHGLSSGLQVRGDELNVEELPFKIEAEDWYTKPYWKKLLLDAQSRHKIFYDELVVKALNMAEKAHRGQTRASGGPYLQHCVETAELLASIGANSTVVAAGLLHDTLDDSFMNYDSVFGTSGAGVADLVKDVSKLSHLSKLARDCNTASKTDEADRLHTMFLAMADVRAVLIKLADRLHNMMTLDALPPAKQQRFAKETLKIFAPLANRLGISSWKEKLENLCFKHLHPDQHEELSSKLEDSFDEATITSAKEKLQHALKESGIPYLYLSGRQKSLYSIYSKMLKKKLTMDEIHDIHGLRLIVDNEEDCYKALRVVHQLWPEVPGRLKDYIIQPKSNGYKSLHTVVDLVVNEETVPLEVQIRTKEMHLQAEFSFAAHWRYKEGDCEHSPFVLRMIEWARWVITWQCETMSSSYPDSIRPSCTFPSHSEDCPHSYKPHCGQDGPVFVIMKDKDKMSVQEFPANSTIMDLLEKSGRGSTSQEELKPRLNLRPVNDTTCKLKMGDVLELTPAIPDKSLTTEYKEKIQKMYDLELTESSTGPSISMVGWGSWP